MLASCNENVSPEDIKDKYLESSIQRYSVKKTLSVTKQVEELYEQVERRNKHETEYLQAVSEVFSSLKIVFEANPIYIKVMEQILEPERVIMFRVPWIDDQGIQQINRGFRVQYSSALGPYKGGLRFHPTVNLSVMKFLAFEQIFKNALTNLRIGGGKGGSDFDPYKKSDNEILRFCQSFMTTLSNYIGIDIDVPAGDIGVGQKEIGYLYGQYKRLKYLSDGSLTGKSIIYGGSQLRPEATGYGAVYFLLNLIDEHNSLAKQNKTASPPNVMNIQGASCVISGSGNVALYVCEKLIELGAIPLTLSDSSGYVYEPQGFTREKLQQVMELKKNKNRRISEYCNKQENKTAKFFAGARPWEISAYDFAFPCATQNEINKVDAKNLVSANCKAVVEGANMPTTPEAIKYLKSNAIYFCPGKAANAGGVSVSALEMEQNSARSQWTRDQVDEKLKEVMKHIYKTCSDCANIHGLHGDLESGANIAGFLKVADAVLELGCI